MPTYNGECFIEKAIKSIQNQTFLDWRLFISDDDSKDNTENICRKLMKTDVRIEYYKQERNIGLFNNFKFVLDKADSEYFIWCAQDDMRENTYLETCIEQLEINKNLGLVTTRMAAIDSFDRTLIEELELTRLSGKPSIFNVTKYILQPEILGKCNLMYGLFRTKVAQITWSIYPQRSVWGQDYHFSLAIISHFEIYVDKKILFKKRLGGISSPEALQNDKKEMVNKIIYKNPKNHIFPFRRFGSYFKGHMEALKGTPYRPLATILLLIRLPRSYIIYLKERNVREYIKSIIKKSICQ